MGLGLEAGGSQELNQKERVFEEIAAYREEHKAGRTIRNRVERLARISMFGLALSGCAPEDEPKFEAALEGERVFSSDMLEKRVSTGTIQLASGETIVIPKPGERFEHAHVYLPKERAPDRAVIVFKQRHGATREFLETQTADWRARALTRIAATQKTIYDELRLLGKHGTTSMVCGEGIIDDEDMEKTTSYYKDFLPIAVAQVVAKYLPDSPADRALKRRDEIHADDHVTVKELRELELDVYPILQSYIATIYKYIVGAAEVLAAEGVVTLCPAEKRATYDAAWSASIRALEEKPRSTWTDQEKAWRTKIVGEDRENAAIELVVSYKQPAIAVQFGDLHDFSNNAEKWNKENPDNLIALVEVGIARP